MGLERAKTAGSIRRGMRLFPRVLPGLFAFAASLTSASAQVADPASADQDARQKEARQAAPKAWEMPALALGGDARLGEEELIGDYGQPRWTARRRFGQTGVYVAPSGVSVIEYWLQPTTPRGAGPASVQTQYRAAFGLPARLQIDLDAVGRKRGREGTFAIDAQRLELRWALASWGRIWGNPTVSAAWEEASNGPDVAELRLLLGGHLASGWHWGSNLALEQERGDTRTTSRAWTTGVSYALKDGRVALGLETRLAFEKAGATATRSAGAGLAREFLVGPSLQIRPLERLHVNVVPLVGVTEASPAAKAIVVAGWEF